MTPISTNTVVGYFSTHDQAQSAVEALKAAGFQAREVGMAARGSSLGRTTQNTTTSGNTFGYDTTTGEHGTGVWDKIKNFFEGDTDQASYTGDPVRGSSETHENTYDDYGSEYGSDDVHHTLAGLSVPEQHSRYFGNRFSSGSEGAVVTVSAEQGRQEQARAILKQCGADLGEGAADYDATSTSRTNTTGQNPREGNYNDKNVTGEQNIRLYGEVLRVHKDRISRGEVVVRKEVRTDMQTVEVPVTREEIVIERRPVSGERAAGKADFGEQEIRIPLSEERASIEKQAVVTEEVRVGKREVSNVQSLNEQVRHEELQVEDSTNKKNDKVKTPA